MTMPESKGPPRSAIRVLRFLLPPSIADAIAGDLHEEYVERVLPAYGRWRADAWFWLQALQVRRLSLARAARRTRPAPSHPKEQFMFDLASDVRHGISALRRARVHSLVAIITVGLALGAVTLVFTIMDAVLLKPLPYAEPDRLVKIWQTVDEFRTSPSAQFRALAARWTASLPVVRDWSAQLESMESLGAFAQNGVVAMGETEAAFLVYTRATSSLFQTLGIGPIAGRTLNESDDVTSAPRVVVLSFEYWQREYGGKRDAIGRSLTIGGQPHTIVGIMPASFYFPERETSFWTNVRSDDVNAQRGASSFEVIGRLKPGVTIAAARADLARTTANLQKQYGKTMPGFGARLGSLLDEVVGGVRRMLLLLMAGEGLLVAVACANVANLLLARGAARQREFAVRRALGANTGRLLRLLICESVVLSLVGATLGFVIAAVGLGTVLKLLPDGMPRVGEVHIGLRAFAFVSALAVTTAVLVGLVPVITATVGNVNGMLREAGRSLTVGRGTRRAQSALIASEVALAFVLFWGAAVLGRSLLRLLSTDTGFAAEDLVVATLRAPARADYTSVFREYLARVRALPGVTDVAWSDRMPFQGGANFTTFDINGEPAPETRRSTETAFVSPSFMRTLGIPLRAGRFISAQDRGAERVVVNEAFVSKFFPNRSPIGQQLAKLGRGTPPLRTIVGVVADIRDQKLEEPPAPKVYLPLFEPPSATVQVVIRVERAAGSLLSELNAVARAVDPTMPLPKIETMSATISRTAAAARFRAVLIGSLGLLAVLLAIAGVYAMVGFAVASRTPEFGIRITLGARTSAIIGNVLAEGLRPAVVGVTVGTAAALGIARVLGSFVYDASAFDPVVLGVCALVLLSMAALGSLTPALRAARLDAVRAINSGGNGS